VQAVPAAHVFKVIDVANPEPAAVELSVSARVKTSHTDAVRQELLDRVERLSVLTEPGIVGTAGGIVAVGDRDRSGSLRPIGPLRGRWIPPNQ